MKLNTVRVLVIVLASILITGVTGCGTKGLDVQLETVDNLGLTDILDTLASEKDLHSGDFDFTSISLTVSEDGGISGFTLTVSTATQSYQVFQQKNSSQLRVQPVSDNDRSGASAHQVLGNIDGFGGIVKILDYVDPGFPVRISSSLESGPVSSNADPRSNVKLYTLIDGKLISAEDGYIRNGIILRVEPLLGQNPIYIVLSGWEDVKPN